MDRFAVSTCSAEQTHKLGTFLGKLAGGGDIYLLSGDLGTGKTCMIQGIAFGLGVKEYACSPSFMIAREYHGRLTLYHLDLYRLDHVEEIIDLGLDDYFRKDAVCAIEWAEKGNGTFPQDNLGIKLEHIAENTRRIEFLPKGARYVRLAHDIEDILKKDREVKWNFP